MPVCLSFLFNCCVQFFRFEHISFFGFDFFAFFHFSLLNEKSSQVERKLVLNVCQVTRWFDDGSNALVSARQQTTTELKKSRKKGSIDRCSDHRRLVNLSERRKTKFNDKLCVVDKRFSSFFFDFRLPSTADNRKQIVHVIWSCLLPFQLLFVSVTCAFVFPSFLSSLSWSPVISMAVRSFDSFLFLSNLTNLSVIWTLGISTIWRFSLSTLVYFGLRVFFIVDFLSRLVSKWIVLTQCNTDWYLISNVISMTWRRMILRSFFISVWVKQWPNNTNFFDTLIVADDHRHWHKREEDKLKCKIAKKNSCRHK